ncbi:MAG: helicase-associated domain-containing protein [Planctomycetes bacterium]|nr:helicase-associated domain-containing protein [Planctomycetota bacterium]
MKLLDKNWIDFVRRVAHWSSLRPRSRDALRSMKTGEKQTRDVFGADFDRLLETRFLEPTAKGDAARPHPEAHSFLRALRAFHRVPVLRDPRDETLRAYLGEHFNDTQRLGLVANKPHAWYGADPLVRIRITSQAHLRGFLDAADPQRWERDRRVPANLGGDEADRPSLGSKGAIDAARRILREAISAGAPIPFTELPQRLAGVEPIDWENGLHACLRFCLLFADVDADGVPIVGIWPPLAKRLNRGTTLEVAAVDARTKHGGIVRLEDLSALLVALSEAPARLKANEHEVFARDFERLGEALDDSVGAMELASGIAFESRPARVERALNVGLARAWFARTRDDGKNVVSVTDAGRRWLGADSDERVRGLLGPLRIAETIDARHARGLRANLGYADCLHWLLPDEFLHSTSQDGESSREAFLRAWRELDRDGFFEIGRWLEHAAATMNPLLHAENGRDALEFLPWELRHRSEDELERTWFRMLASAIADWMWPFGGIELAVGEQGRTCMRLTPIGRYLIGAGERIEHDVSPVAAGRVIVQPNFEVVFLAPSSAAEAVIARFCTRRGRGVGTLFEITRDACRVASAAGMSADQALEELTRVSARAIPQNVAHEVRAWFGSIVRVQMSNVEIVRCPDAATARRVASAAGGKVRALTDTVLELLDGSQRSVLDRALRKQGIFVDRQSADEDAQPRRRRR